MIVVRREDYAIFAEVGEEGWSQRNEACFGGYASISAYCGEQEVG